MNFSNLLTMVLQLLPKLTTIVSILPSIFSLYLEISKGDIKDPKTLQDIVSFAVSKHEVLKKYVSPQESLMLICAIIGVLHEGDSSNLYEDAKNVTEK